ncbi:MAG TPA: hypothetical protein DCY10_07050 [Clostridiales bacterium]|nr:hypothetical protein [Clostridiales bacterium]
MTEKERDHIATLLDALDEVVAATGAYLTPDGINKDECIRRILAATDNPGINLARHVLKRASGSEPHIRNAIHSTATQLEG